MESWLSNAASQRVSQVLTPKERRELASSARWACLNGGRAFFYIPSATLLAYLLAAISPIIVQGVTAGDLQRHLAILWPANVAIVGVTFVAVFFGATTLRSQVFFEAMFVEALRGVGLPFLTSFLMAALVGHGVGLILTLFEWGEPTGFGNVLMLSYATFGLSAVGTSWLLSQTFKYLQKENLWSHSRKLIRSATLSMLVEEATVESRRELLDDAVREAFGGPFTFGGHEEIQTWKRGVVTDISLVRLYELKCWLAHVGKTSALPSEWTLQVELGSVVDDDHQVLAKVAPHISPRARWLIQDSIKIGSVRSAQTGALNLSEVITDLFESAYAAAERDEVRVVDKSFELYGVLLKTYFDWTSRWSSFQEDPTSFHIALPDVADAALGASSGILRRALLKESGRSVSAALAFAEGVLRWAYETRIVANVRKALEFWIQGCHHAASARQGVDRLGTWWRDAHWGPANLGLDVIRIRIRSGIDDEELASLIEILESVVLATHEACAQSISLRCHRMGAELGCSARDLNQEVLWPIDNPIYKFSEAARRMKFSFETRRGTSFAFLIGWVSAVHSVRGELEGIVGLLVDEWFKSGTRLRENLRTVTLAYMKAHQRSTPAWVREQLHLCEDFSPDKWDETDVPLWALAVLLCARQLFPVSTNETNPG